MTFKIDDKVIEAAAKAPKIFVDASLGEGDEYNRDPGLQVTKAQIISLRKYETLGLSLPVRLQDVVAYLNYGAGETGGTGLGAQDFLRTFTMTYDHASRWSPLREKIMLTGTDLKVFAGSIIGVGNEIVEVYTEHKASKFLEEHNINTPEDFLKLPFKDLPDIELHPGDVTDIRYYLNDLLGKVKFCHDKAEVVRSELDRFGSDMRKVVLPEIKLRLEFVKKNTYQKDVQDLQDEIDQRSQQIDELSKQYDQLVQEAIKAAAILNVGGLILGIYQGVKAEKIRRERNQLKEAQQVANQKMAGKNQTLTSLNKVRDDLQNLTDVAIEAEIATQNLMLVWNALSLYITASYDEVGKLDEAASLRRFKNQIISIVEPWVQIRGSSDQLLRVFAEADAEYENNRLVFKSKMAMHSLFNSSEHPAFNMAGLRNHNAALQAVNTTAQMLVEQYNYLPGTVGTMNNLAVAINKITYDLRNQAQTNIIALGRAKKELEILQSDLGSPDELEEIREDMEKQLNSVRNTISTQAVDLKSVHKSISAPYDRANSEALIVTLQQDRTLAEELKSKSEEKLAELNEQIKSVSEAIDLIGKAGVEKIGEEAQLSLDNLKALGLAPPQVQIALLAIDTLKKLISGIGEAINYLNMLAAYNRLRQKAADLKAQAQIQINHITKIDGKIELLKTLDELDDGRWSFVSEFSNLVADFEKFSREFKQDESLSVEEQTDSAISRISEVVTYLNPIKQL